LEAVWDAKTKNLRRIVAGIANGRKRRPWDEQDRQRLREQCLRRRPWLKSCSPRTQEGKHRSRANGYCHRPNPNSAREIRACVGDVNDFIGQMAELRREILG
jgi:hypothetical protein